MNSFRIAALYMTFALAWVSTPAESEPVKVTYLANEGVRIAQGAKAVLIDALFSHDFEMYQQLPKAEQRKLLKAAPPYDEVDLVLITHRHDDHFQADAVVSFLRNNASAVLVSSDQVVDLVKAAEGYDGSWSDRVVPLSLENGETTFESHNGIDFLAYRVAHAGGPQRADIANLAYGVRFGDELVLHLGDAGDVAENFEALDLAPGKTDLALVPAWFFFSEEGRHIVRLRIAAWESVGIHVWTDLAEEAVDEVQTDEDWTLFDEFGETRVLGRPGGG